jgi:hypothetical protein
MIRFNTENVAGKGGFGTLSYFSDLLPATDLVNLCRLAPAAFGLRVLYLLSIKIVK